MDPEIRVRPAVPTSDQGFANSSATNETTTATLHDPIKRIERIVLDDEDQPAAWPFADHSVDLVVCGMETHWLNELPAVLYRAKQILRPDGMFLGAMQIGRASCRERVL